MKNFPPAVAPSLLWISLFAFAGCAGAAAKAPGPRVDLAQVRFTQGYQMLGRGRPDSAAALFAEGLRWSRKERSPDEGGRWGQALAERLSGRTGFSDSVLVGLPPARKAESLFANGWLTELSGDTLGSLTMYARAVHADTLWPPPYVRSARLRAARTELPAAFALLDRAMALGDTGAAALRDSLIPPLPLTPEQQLALSAAASAALSRLQLAGLLRAHGAIGCPARYPEPELDHFRAVRDSLGDMAGTAFVGLARDAVILGRMEIFPDGSFRPNDLIERGRFALWLDRFGCAGLAAASGLPPDVAPGDYRADAIRRSLGAGLLTVRPGGRFDPDVAITGVEAKEALRHLPGGS